ncbi:MAG: class I SAM-dependent methyltransferase [Magnetococcales bacterium]|nr:class I SAM-dependent methyltransferase [Magnetococcales bacterium]NGZ04995.1 class I SAM-dependent methyltransferase [Magnetococcales bacterium]
MNDAHVWDNVWNDDRNHEDWNYLSHIIHETVDLVLQREFHAHQPAVLLAEAGCGSGRISIRLGHSRQAHVIFLDFSAVSVRHLQTRLHRAAMPGWVIQGDLFQIPLQDESLDLIWNAGVLEHFVGDRQRAAVAEMLRVLKPEGILVTLNPYAGSVLHTLGKACVEQVTTYPYGEEFPIHTLEHHITALGATLAEQEYSIGFVALFVGVFKRLMIMPGLSFFRYVYRFVDAVFCTACRIPILAKGLRRADLWLARHLGGYLLVTVARKSNREINEKMTVSAAQKPDSNNP